MFAVDFLFSFQVHQYASLFPFKGYVDDNPAFAKITYNRA